MCRVPLNQTILISKNEKRMLRREALDLDIQKKAITPKFTRRGKKSFLSIHGDDLAHLTTLHFEQDFNY